MSTESSAPGDDWLSCEELAVRLRVSTDWVRRRAADQAIPSQSSAGGFVGFSPSDVAAIHLMAGDPVPGTPSIDLALDG